MNMEHTSFWQREKMPEFSPLPGDTDVNTVIVGGGLCGLLTAYFLIEKGVKDIALIDAGKICSGVTAHTTAKITSQHGLIYAKLLNGFGRDEACQYLSANQSAVRQYEGLTHKHQIDCDFTLCNAWIYTTSEERIDDIRQEVDAAQSLGIEATFETQSELPFPIQGMVRFPNQAHFHPTKFIRHICKLLMEFGCQIYTDTTATGAEQGIVYTDRGNIRTEHIISCSHYPFIDKHTLLFSKIYQERSYVLALKGLPAMQDMYLDCEDGGFSFRPQKDEHGKDMLLFGAYDHKTGHENFKLHFQEMKDTAKSLYPQSEVAYMWSAQDCMTHDKIPYIGRYPSAGENIFVATGFNKWGMTSSMVAAQLISDEIIGKGREYEVFSLDRKDLLLQAKSFIKESADIVGNFLTHLTMADERLRDIESDAGGIVEIDGQRVGVYKDKDGELYAVKSVCTHMGCAVKWNKDENTWDCTCHGSRFDYLGNVLGGPALKPLDRLKIIQ